MNQNISIGLFLLIASTVFAQLSLVSNQQIDFSNAISSVNSGNWSNPNTWSNGTVPNANTDVIISNNNTVYVDVQGSGSDQIVDLCRNLSVNQTAKLHIGHNTPNFAKDLRINGSILCNGTISSGRNLPSNGVGDGLIYDFNSRIYLNLTHQSTYISGSGFFYPKILNISSNDGEKNLIIDLYNMQIDDNFAIKSDYKVNVTIEKYAYVKIGKVLGLTGSTFQFSAPTAKASLNIKGIVIADDVSLFTRNTTVGETTSLTIENNGVLAVKKINNGQLNVKAQAAGFNFTIQNGGIFRLGENINFDNLTINNPNLTLVNSGSLRPYYLSTFSSTTAITNAINQHDPNITGVQATQAQYVFGASHIAGWYNFTDEPFMKEGLDKYQEFGATSVKTALSDVNGRMDNSYPFNHSWPNFPNITAVAQSPYLNDLFQRPNISRHTFWVTLKNQGHYKNGPDFDHDLFLKQEEEYYNLTFHLLQTYGNMNKSFVYQNWEGDWMLRGEGVNWEGDPSTIPDDVEWEIEGMARMFRARQRGTERARNQFQNANAKVYHAIEFNKLWMVNGSGNRVTMMQNNTPSVLGNVIPATRIDLSSWSAYDGGWTNNNNPEGHAMWKGLEVAKYFTNQTGFLPANTPVQIGEFAINENPPFSGNNNENVIRSKYGRYIGVALGLGIPNFYLWNFYCSGAQAGPPGHVWEKGVQYEESFLYQWMDGKWLVEPDGSWGHAATFLMEQWNGPLSNENPQFVDETILYPNPTNGNFTLKGLKNNATISIFDTKGTEVAYFQSLNETETFEVTHLQKGLYFLTIKNENQPTITKKLLIN